MARLQLKARAPADIRRRVVLSRVQRDWINAVAAALEAHAERAYRVAEPTP